MKTKLVYLTEKRKFKIAIRKFYAIMASILIASGFIVWHSMALKNEIGDNQVFQGVKAQEALNKGDKSLISEIWEMAEKAEMKKEDIIKMMTIIQCESGFEIYAINYNAKSKSWDTGIAQWNSKFHPEISRECSFDWKCAIEKMIELFKKDGNFNQWSCNK